MSKSKHANWLLLHYGVATYFVCSNCGYDIGLKRPIVCPSCKREMDNAFSVSERIYCCDKSE